MEKQLTLTTRELSEFKHSMFYAQECHHGTTGHNQLMLLAKVADFLGFVLVEGNTKVVTPSTVTVDDGPATGHGKAG